MRVNLEYWQRKKGFVCLCKWRLTLFELATTLKNLGAKWLSEKKINFMPCNTIRHFLKANTIQKCMSSLTQQNIQPSHEVWRWEHCLDCLWSCESKKKKNFPSHFHNLKSFKLYSCKTKSTLWRRRGEHAAKAISTRVI